MRRFIELIDKMNGIVKKRSLMLSSLACFLLAWGGAVVSGPSEQEGLGKATGVERFEETLLLNLRLDSTGAELNSFSLRPQPIQRERDAERPTQGAVGQGDFFYELIGARGEVVYNHRFEAPGICFLHNPGDPPHVEGDVVRPHSMSFLLKIPFVRGVTAARIVRQPTGSRGERLAPPAQHALIKLTAAKFAGTAEEYGQRFGWPVRPEL